MARDRELARLKVKLEAESAQLRKELEKTNSRLKKWESSTKRTVRNVKKAFNGLANIAVGAVLTKLGADAVRAADQIAKLSTRLNISVEALSQYKFVAQQTGVQFTQLTQSFQRQSRRISEAASGYGEAQVALKELGLSAKALNQLSPERQFEIIADAMQGVSNSADRLRIAVKLWDQEGASMIQVAEGGATAVRQLRAQGDALGATLTKLEAEQMERVTNAFGELSTATHGLGKDIIVALANPLVQLANVFSSVLPNAVKSNVAVLNKFQAFMLNTAASVSEFLAKIQGMRAKILPERGIFRLLAESLGGDSAKDALKAQREHLENAVEFRQKAGEALERVLDISIKLNKPIAVNKGSPLDLMNGGAATGGLFDTQSIGQSMDEFEMMILTRAEAQAVELEKIEQKHQKVIQGMRADTVQNTIGLFQALGVKSKKFALVALALEKATAIQRVLIQSKVAAMAALTPPPIGLGPVAGAPLAAKIEASGYINAGLIAATGAIQAHNLLSGDSNALADTSNRFPEDQAGRGGGVTIIVKSHDSKDVARFFEDNKDLVYNAVQSYENEAS